MPIQSGFNKGVDVITEPAKVAHGRLSGGHLTISERVDTETLYAEAGQDATLIHTLRDTLPAALSNRVVFVDVATTTPIADCLHHARQEVGQSPRNAGDLIVVGRGKHSRMAESLEQPSNAETKKTLGAVAETLISGGVRASILVLQAGGRGLDT
jgi:nucleotide-binding universal stress UspA family protein